MEYWETLERRTILAHSRFLTVEEHKVRLPDGRVIANWPWIITPDYVNILVLTDKGQYILFRQVKYAVEGTTLALVGGYTESGETAQEAAQRELLEETGYESNDWIELGCYPVDGNRGVGKAFLFLARGARQIAEPNADDLEEQTMLFMDRATLRGALDAGEFKVLPWATAVALALLIDEA